MRDRTNRDSYRSARTKKATYGILSLMTVTSLWLFVLSSKACRIPRLPQELHLKVIDLIAVDLNDYGFGHPDLQSTLLSCMLVCHFWLSYARQHLYRNIHINASEQSRDLMRWRACVKYSSSRSISLTVKTVHISFFESTSSLSAFLVFQRLSNLRCLFLHRLDLKKEPISLYKAIAHLVSLYYVDLHHLEECTATELIRFINSFHSLSKLNISFHHNASRLKIGGHLPSLLNPHKLTLESLKIRPIPGISTLLRWMVRTRSFVTRLKKLTIEFKNGKLTESRYQGIDELIGHCGGHLEELILYPNWVTVSEEIHNLGKIILLYPHLH